MVKISKIGLADPMEISQDTPAPKFPAKGFLVWLGAGVLILNLFVIFMAVVSLRQSWRNHQDRAIATAQNLTLVLDRFVSDTFTKADLAVWAVKDEAEQAASSPLEVHPDLDAFIQRQRERVPGLLALRTTNAQGVFDHGTGIGAGLAVSVADREYFIRLRDVPEAGLVISRPMVERATGTWSIILARRLERPGHSFAGTVHAVIALDEFNRAFSALDVGPHGSVALRDLDLGLIARHPEPIGAGTAIGQRVVSPEFRTFARSGRDAGTYQARTPFDHVQRTFFIRRVSGQPFYLLVGLAERDYLSGWWREVIQEFTEVALFICLTLVAAWLVHRVWLRQNASHGNLEKLLADVRTLGGMLPICSHCKKIRDDKGYWNQIEAYLNERIDAEFTHGICPDCAKEVFPNSGKQTSI